MRIIYDSYEKDCIYDDYGQDLEKKVLNYIKEGKNVNDILKEDYNTDIQNIFSNRTENIINFLDLNKNDSCLEILGRFGTFTEILSKKFKSVTSVETIKDRAEINYKRNLSKRNIDIICTSNIMSIKYPKKFDVIFMIDVIENINAIFDDYNTSNNQLCIKLLNRFKKLLNPGGKIIILTNNKLGIKYFAGAKDYENESSYSNLSSSPYKYNRYFSKNELNCIISNLDFKRYKYYYVMPDIYNASVIYSDEYLPSKDSSKLNYNMYYNSFDTVVFNEIEATKEITKSGYFDTFANSYIIELGENLSEVKFASFNNFRKEKYKLMTKMKGNTVIKSGSTYQISSVAKNIKLLNDLNVNLLDKFENDKILSMYCCEDNLEKIVYNKLISNNENDFFDEINRYIHYIEEKMVLVDLEDMDESDTVFSKYGILVEKELFSKFRYVKHGFIDLTFDNIFEVGNKYFVYDQEWYEQYVPIEFIVYRAINRFFFNNKIAKNIVDEKKVYDYYNLSEYINIFNELEAKWLEEISDKDVLKYFESTYSGVTSLESLKNTLLDLEYYKGIVENQRNYISKLENENQKLKQSHRKK